MPDKLQIDWIVLKILISKVRKFYTWQMRPKLYTCTTLFLKVDKPLGLETDVGLEGIYPHGQLGSDRLIRYRDIWRYILTICELYTRTTLFVKADRRFWPHGCLSSVLVHLPATFGGNRPINVGDTICELFTPTTLDEKVDGRCDSGFIKVLGRCTHIPNTVQID